MISAFGVVHTIEKRDDLVPPEGRPSKYTKRIEDVRAQARNKYAKPTGPGSLRAKMDPSAWETRIAAARRFPK